MAPDDHARDYAVLNAVWAAGTLGLLRVTGDRAAPPGRELPVLGLASFTVAKALSKEKVGRWARAPVLEADADGGRHPRGTGMRAALGELMMCSRCLGTWSALGLVGLRVMRPREGQIVAGVLAVAAINDALQAGFVFATSSAVYEHAHAEREVAALG